MNRLLIFPIMFVLFISIVYAANMLEISDFSIEYDSDTTRFLTDGSTYNDFIAPGDSIEVNVEVTNNFKTNTHINDVEITAAIYDITEGTDVSETSDSFDINDGAKKSKTFTLDIPTNAEEVQKLLKVSVTGTDENGTDYSVNRTVYLNIEDVDHDVYVYSNFVNPATITCNQKSQLFIWLFNDGQFDEDKVVLKVNSTELGLSKTYNSLDIDQGEKYTKVIALGPYNTSKPGKYPIELKVYYKDTHLDDKASVDLIIKKCMNQTFLNQTQVSGANSTLSHDEEDVLIEDDNQNDSSKAKVYRPIAKPQDSTNMFLIFSLILAAVIIIIIILFNLMGKKEDIEVY